MCGCNRFWYLHFKTIYQLCREVSSYLPAEQSQTQMDKWKDSRTHSRPTTQLHSLQDSTYSSLQRRSFSPNPLCKLLAIPKSVLFILNTKISLETSTSCQVYILLKQIHYQRASVSFLQAGFFQRNTCSISNK